MNIKRAARLKQAADLWKQNKGRGTIVAVTGVGKTAMALDNIINPMLEKIPNSRVLIIVSTTPLKEQWLERITHDRVDIEVINTSITKLKRSYDLIVYDEVHRYGGPEFSKAFLIKSKWKLCLTGTLHKEMRDFLDKQKLEVVDTISRKEALENGWVSDYTEFNLSIQLDLKTSEKLKRYDQDFEKKTRFLTSDVREFKISDKVLEHEVVNGKKVYAYAQEIANRKNVNVGVVIGTAMRLKAIAKDRNELVYNYREKFTTAKKVIDLFKGKKIVTFCLHSKTADKLKELTGGESLHNKTKKPGKVLKDFSEGNILLVHTCKKLNEGSDIPNLEVAVNFAYYSKPNANGQRLGRIIRKEGEKHSIFINLYTKFHPRINDFTPEQYWLNISQKDRQDDVVWVDSINEIVEFLSLINGNDTVQD